MESRKETIHSDLQQLVQQIPGFDGAALAKWWTVMEFVLPDGSHSLVQVSSDAGGRDLFPWESRGMCLDALDRQR